MATAVELVRAEGLAKVTMRRLAQELDTGAASLYVYVRNTAELHAAVLDELLGSVELELAGGWRDRLGLVLRSYMQVLFEYPGLAQSALVARPAGANYLRLIEALLALLSEGGVPKAQAAWGIDLLLQTATATAVEYADSGGSGVAGEWEATASAVRNLSSDTHPQLAELGDDLFAGPGQARLEWGIRVLINGISSTPRDGNSL